MRRTTTVGEGIANHIHEILRTGDYSLRRRLLKKYPPSILQLLEVQSLGPKKIALLWKKFHVATVPQLGTLARQRKLRKLRGFGEKSEQNILKAAQQFKHLYGSGRFHINVADDEARDLIAYIRQWPAVESAIAAGSLRRGKETIGDVDLLVTMKPGRDKQKDVDTTAAQILAYERIKEKVAHGENKGLSGLRWWRTWPRKSDMGVKEFRTVIDAKHPLGHICEPDDIAWGIVYLTSEEAQFVTGAELVIDGGYTAQ